MFSTHPSLSQWTLKYKIERRRGLTQWRFYAAFNKNTTLIIISLVYEEQNHIYLQTVINTKNKNKMTKCVYKWFKSSGFSQIVKHWHWEIVL